MNAAAQLANLVPTLILRSPAHRLMSGRYTLLRFRGRRSGTLFTIPVAYVRDGDRIVISTDSAWRVNVRGGRAVEARIGGQWRAGTATRVVTPPSAARLLRKLVDEVPGYSRPAGIPRVGGTVTDEAVRDALADRWVISIRGIDA